MSDKLKPCRYCGSDSEYEYSVGYVRPICCNPKCVVNGNTYYKTKEAAAKAWNASEPTWQTEKYASIKVKSEYIDLFTNSRLSGIGKVFQEDEEHIYINWENRTHGRYPKCMIELEYLYLGKPSEELEA